jgi:16S rRNA (adenine1518-N6/adenine1519-N6)-dimethyltransferase
VNKAQAPTTPGAIREALASAGLAPLHRLGQHFLADPRVCERIAAAAEAVPAAPCLEIGPGLGALTAALVRAGRRVVAVEIDRGLVAYLREAVAASGADVAVVEGDARTVDLAALSPPTVTVLMGNLPYYASSPLLRRTLALGYPLAVLMLQREVADRLAAAAGSTARGALAVLAEATATVERLFAVAPPAFYPRPEVESVVVRLRRRVDALDAEAYERLDRVVSAGFRYRRKGVRQALRHALGLTPSAVAAALERAGVDGRARPEDLTLAQWQALTRATTPRREGGDDAP